jgi:hypothetical protein
MKRSQVKPISRRLTGGGKLDRSGSLRNLRSLPLRVLPLTSIMLSTLSTFLIAAGCVTAVVDASSNTSSSTSSWKWKETQHIFSFGDSQAPFFPRYRISSLKLERSNETPITSRSRYTATNYGSIFGPDPNYSTTSGGGTWITYLTSTYNSSAISTYNFAWGGATIDTELVRQSSPSTQSLKSEGNPLL